MTPSAAQPQPQSAPSTDVPPPKHAGNTHHTIHSAAEAESVAADGLPVAVVTGATGGMGSAIVRDLVRTHRVIALGRSRAALDALTAETGAQGIAVDFAHPELLAPALVQANLPSVAVLVHTAAVAVPRGVASALPQDWSSHFAVNVTSAAELTRLLLPGLREQAGTVIFIGSGAGTRPVPGSAVYAASKHALRAVADTLRIDEEPHRIRVATLAPGQTATKMSQQLLDADLGELLIQPESVAQGVRFLVDAPADVHLTDLAVRPRQEIARL